MTIDTSQFDLILQPYANQGDKTVPPQNSPTGFANFLDGYTNDYEISLKSGNPQAKAVERRIQNYLFNQSTDHQMLWQQAGLPPWFAGMTTNGVAGYQINAVVIRYDSGSSVWRPYRSLTNNNITDPLTTPASWELIRTFAEILAVIPMPSGAGVAANELISVATDFNTLLSSGTFEFSTDAVVSGSANSPSDHTGTARAGMLEVKTWGAGATQVYAQRYLDRTGRIFTRGRLGPAAFSSWLLAPSAVEVQTGTYNYVVDSGVKNAVVGTFFPGIGTAANGRVVRVKIAVTNDAATTFNDGSGAKPVVGLGGTALAGGELIANRIAVLQYNSSIGTGSYTLLACEGGAQQLGSGSYLSGTPPQFNQSAQIITASWASQRGVQYSGVAGVANGASLAGTLAHVGGVVLSSGTGSNTYSVPNSASSPAIPSTARLELINIANAGMTVNRQGSDTFTLPNGSVVTSFIVPAGTQAWLVYIGSGAWLVQGLAVVQYDARLASSFASPNGWVRLQTGSGIWIYQWGTVTGVPAASGASATFPITFPNALLSVGATIKNSAGSAAALAAGVGFESASGMTVFNNGNGLATAINYYAVGY